MKIAIFNKGIPYDGRTPFVQPLGGSESGVVHMARELGRLGHDLTVYCNCPEPGLYDGVNYKHHRSIFDDYAYANWDVVVTFRSFEPLLIGRIAPRMIFWTGDDCDQQGQENLTHPSIRNNIDFVFCVSEWHKQRFVKAFGLPADKIVATRNGFVPELVPSGVPKCWTQGVYTSTPFRGLEFLLTKIFPELRARIPGMSLDVFSSMKVYQWTDDQDNSLNGHIYRAAVQPGVTMHGGVPQPDLLQAMAPAGFLLYPNTFEETSCIAAIESQASGAVVVTSARAGLNETVEDQKTGICLKGDPASNAYQAEFVRTVCALLANPARLEELSANARRRAFGRYTWNVVAREWVALFETMTAKPVHRRYDGPIFQLERARAYQRSGNAVAARRALAGIEGLPFLKTGIDEIQNAFNVEVKV